MSVVSVVCCQVEVSATRLSLVQRSPTDCGASTGGLLRQNKDKKSCLPGYPAQLVKHLFYVHLIITNVSFPYASVYFTCLYVVRKHKYESFKDTEILIPMISYNLKILGSCDRAS